MTCIAGIVHNGYTYIAGERSISDQEVILPLTRPKIHKRGNWIFGYAGSMGIGQLMEFINFPGETGDPYSTLRLNIVDEYRKALASFGTSNDEDNADILVGYEDKLFEFNTGDWSVMQVNETAVGSGSHFALGSLYTSLIMTDDPRQRLMYALEATIHYSPTCIGKIDIISTE